MKTSLFVVVFSLMILNCWSQTTIASQNFDASTSWSYSTVVGGDGVFSTSNSIGVSSSNGLGYYYDNCLTGSGGSTSSATFTTVDVTGYTNIKIRFRMAWGGTHWGNTCGSGTGIDTDDYIEVQASRNGGAYGRVCYYNGYSNRTFAHNTTSKVLAYNANESHRADAWGNVGTWEITFPAGTTSVGLKFITKCNRDHENFYLDNFIVEGFNALPVEMIDFKATRTDEVALISWQTASETNSSHFIVQKTNNSIDFATIGYVAAAGNNNTGKDYQFVDYDADLDESCYRLLQFDFDGTEYDMGIRCLAAKDEDDNTLVFYNSDDKSIVVSGYNQSCSLMELTDLMGRLVMSCSPSSEQTQLNVSDGSGLYLMQVVSDGKRKVFKVFVD
jgi:hypothetical protein